jgi:hypothetical protein
MLPAVDEVGALLEPELADVELQRAILIGDGNEHRPDLGDTGHAPLLSRGSIQ